MCEALIDRHVDVVTHDGTMGTYVAHPVERGPHPVVLFLMDAPGKRELLHSMSRRLAAEGYYVMLPNLYYRTTEAFELDFASKESFALMSELMRSIGNRMVGRDAGALLAFARGDADADVERVGVVGYCMSGPFALWVAAEHADCVKAAASIYGVRLHVDSTDSPHLRLAEIPGELYIAAAEHDDYVPLDMIDRFEAELQATGTSGRVERYWGLHHGFAFDDRPAHDVVGEARHWDRLFDLFARNLHPKAS